MKAILHIFMVTALCALSHQAEATDQVKAVPAEVSSFAVQVHGRTYYTGYLKRDMPKGGRKYVSFAADNLPDSWDERTDRGCVTPIRNQGSCGSCWDFSRTAALEAATCIAGLSPSPNVLDLSEQDTLVNDKSNYGCSGGFMGFDFEVKHGVALESDCPYDASGSRSCSAPAHTHALSWTFVGSESGPTDDDLRAAIYKYGVVSVTTAAGGSFDTDSNGEFVGCRDSGINHMVDLVGYRKNSSGAWEFLMRNSWGTSWGQAGYGWLKRGCEETAVGSESAAIVVVDGPGPTPPLDVHVPIEVITAKGVDVMLGVNADDGISYSWSNGDTGAMTWVTADASKVITLTATDAKGNKVSATTNIIVQ